eukprot:scaffold1339_cov23-Prasinocladus_malaysianus.AAC.1
MTSRAPIRVFNGCKEAADARPYCMYELPSTQLINDDNGAQHIASRGKNNAKIPLCLCDATNAESIALNNVTHYLALSTPHWSRSECCTEDE